MSTHAEHELALAASGLTREDFEWLKNINPEISRGPDSQDLSSQEESSQDLSSQEESSGPEQEPGKQRTRRSVKHSWPDTGTVLKADYEGTHYEAEVIAAPKYKSGKALKILTGPAAGKTASSMSAAMLLATEKQRLDDNLGRKGVSNGWNFWTPK